MSGFSFAARTVALAAALALAGGAMAKAPSTSAGMLQDSTAGGGGATPDVTGTQIVTALNVAGIGSFSAIGQAANTVITLQFSPFATVTGIGWNVILSAFTPSWLSEMAVAFENSDQSDGVLLNIGDGDDFSALNTAYNSGGIIDLVPLNLSFNLGADGLLRLEFYEDFDDAAVDPDGRWVSGTLSIDVTGVVPEPSTYGLMALGLLAVVGAARRRRAD